MKKIFLLVLMLSSLGTTLNAFSVESNYMINIKKVNAKVINKLESSDNEVEHPSTKVCHVSVYNPRFNSTWGVAMGKVQFTLYDGTEFDFGNYIPTTSTALIGNYDNGRVTVFSRYNSTCYSAGNMIKNIPSCSNNYWLWANGTSNIAQNIVNIYFNEGQEIDSMSFVETFDGARGMNSYTLRLYDCNESMIFEQEYTRDTSVLLNTYLRRTPISFRGLY